MPKTKISEYSTTNSSNTDIEGINIDEGCAPSGINNAIRELMVHLKEFQTGASGDAFTFAGGVLISGTANTITGNVLMSGTNTMTGSTTATFAAGAVGTPSIAAHGDTNTGVYFPAADEVAVAAGGSIAAAFNSHQFMGMRNRIINGDMRIDQRNAGAAVTANNAFPVDRFFVPFSTDGAFSAQQDSSTPAGFVNSLKFTTTTADATIGATQYAMLRQVIEGFNVADLGWGTANAKTVTLSFWVRSSLTGTFGGSLQNNAEDRSYPFSYTISSANTWEQKTITVVGDTTGTWLTTNGRGIRLAWGLGVGSTYSGTAGAWSATPSLYSVTGAVNVMGTLNATWYITGVQLEVGSVATPFERRPYGTELALCQRYYYRIKPGQSLPFGSCAVQTTSDAEVYVYFPVTMRAAPTALEQSGTAANYGVFIANAITTCNAVPTFNWATQNVGIPIFTNTNGVFTVGRAGTGYAAGSANGYLGWSAEL